MASNPKFHALLADMATVHDRKNEDYAHGGNPYSNFEEAAVTAGTTVDTVFAVLIGIKLARLNALKGKEPNNESVQDSRLDLAVYSALWASYHGEEQELPPCGAPCVTPEDAFRAGWAAHWNQETPSGPSMDVDEALGVWRHYLRGPVNAEHQ